MKFPKFRNPFKNLFKKKGEAAGEIERKGDAAVKNARQAFERSEKNKQMEIHRAEALARDKASSEKASEKAAVKAAEKIARKNNKKSLEGNDSHYLKIPPKKKEKLTTQVRRKHLQTFLAKSGYPDADSDKLAKRIMLLAIILTGVLWFIVAIMILVNNKSIIDLLIYSVGHWTALFAIIWLLIWGVVYFFLEMRMYNRTKELEEVLPDFLQLTSANISAGMPIDRALWLAIRPNFGVLAKEIEDVAKATLSGEDLADSLRQLVARYDSVMLKRSISILLEGLDAGGELAVLLNKIALNIQELKIMRKEMAANVTTYAIFISFASVGIAPILFALATQLIHIILNITSGLDLSAGASSMISISTDIGPGLIRDFKIYCILMLSVTAGMSAAIISVIRRGNIREGIKNIPVYIIISLILYMIANSALATMFGGFF